MSNKTKTDCLIIGFNDSEFEGYAEMVRSMGSDSGAYRDLNLAFINYRDKPYRSLDILNHFYYEDKKDPGPPFHNADFLWPVVTYLGSYLANHGFSFDYVNLFHLEQDKLREKLLNDDILTIAITTTLYVSPHPIIEIISFIRRYNQTAKILLGGPYMSNQTKMYEQAGLQRQLKYLGADIYVISNEGETALINILSALKTGSSLDAVDNLAYKKGKEYVITATSTESNPLEDNVIDYKLFPKQDVGEFLSLRTAKSCPFSCSFCGFPQRAGKYKYLTVELVEHELNAIREIGGVTTLTFLDDTFNVPKDRFREMLIMMANNNYGFKWNSFYRSDHGDAETIELMAKAGCEGVFLGIESGSDQQLERMNKTSRRHNYLTAIPQMRDVGIATHANVIVGFPGETYDTYYDTVSLIEEAKPDFFRAQLWYADPVTPIWEKRDQYGIKGSSFNWTHHTMDHHTASDLVEKMFLSVKGSTWLPQNGFEQWSTFYLQRRGMKLPQIKQFLQCFNAIIKEKLIKPSETTVSPGLLESLRQSCKFDQPVAPDMRPVEMVSGERFKKAEQYLVAEFAGTDGQSNLKTVRESPGSQSKDYLIERSVITGDTYKLLESRGAPGAGETILAALGVLMSRLSGREDTVILAATDKDSDAVPLRLLPSWDASFGDYANVVSTKLTEGREHSRYGMHILTNPYRMTEHGSTCPIFDVGYSYTDNWTNPGNSPERTLLECRTEKNRLPLTLNVVKTAEAIEINFLYASGVLREETVAELSRHLIDILDGAVSNADVTIGDIGTGQRVLNQPRDLGIDAAEAFNF